MARYSGRIKKIKIGSTQVIVQAIRGQPHRIYIDADRDVYISFPKTPEMIEEDKKAAEKEALEENEMVEKIKQFNANFGTDCKDRAEMFMAAIKQSSYNKPHEHKQEDQ